MKLHDIRKSGIYDRIITASNFVIGDNGTKKSKEILITFKKLVELSENEYQKQKKYMEVIMGRRKKAFTNYTINKNIAKTLVLHRVWNGYTQTQLAKCINVSFQQIQKYERCINRLAAENLIDICKQKRWDIQLFTNDKPEAIFEEWCKSVDISKIDSPYPLRADQIQRSWDKIEEVGEQNYYNEHSPRYKNIIKEMRGD